MRSAAARFLKLVPLGKQDLGVLLAVAKELSPKGMLLRRAASARISEARGQISPPSPIGATPKGRS